MIRNPYDAILSITNFYATRSHLGILNVNKTLTKPVEWEKSVRNLFQKQWIPFYEYWLLKRKDIGIHVVVYEDLCKNVFKELTKMVDFLGLKFSNKNFNCLKKKLNGKFHRTKPSALKHLYEVLPHDLKFQLSKSYERFKYIISQRFQSGSNVNSIIE